MRQPTPQRVFCDVCDFTANFADYLPQRHPRYVYDMGDGAIFPMQIGKSWCRDCGDFVWIEEPPTLDTIAAYRASHEKDVSAHSTHAGGVARSIFEPDRGGLNDYELFEAVCLTHEAAWKAYAGQRVGTKARCLRCRSDHTSGKINIDRDEEGVFVRFSHPGCGGNLQVIEIETPPLFISWRDDPGVSIRFFDAELRVIGPHSRRLEAEELLSRAKPIAGKEKPGMFPHYGQPVTLLQSNPFFCRPDLDSNQGPAN